MTRARGAPAAAAVLAPVPTLMAPSVGRLFAVAWVAITLLWLPLSVIPIADGLLFVATPLDVLRDLALLSWLGLLPAAVLVGLAWAARTLARALGADTRRASLWAWSLLLLPLVWACSWQAARMGWQWLRAVSGSRVELTQEWRAAAVAVLLLLLCGALWRWSLRGLLQRLAAGLYGARVAAAVVMIVALVGIGLRPPAVLLGAEPFAPVPAGVRSNPDIIVIMLDTLAMVDADACNPNSATMPRLAAFAGGASCFTRAYAASNFTTPTTSTFESSLLPWSHFATQPDAKMAQHTRGHTLAAVLKAQGWRTHAITDNLLGSPRHRGTFAAYSSSGFAHTTLYGNWFREAMTVFPDTALPRLAANALSFLGSFDMLLHGHDSPYVAERTYEAMHALMQREPRDAPMFLWALTLPPHSPYLPPPTTKYQLLPPGELETWRQMLPDNIEYGARAQPLVDKHRLRYRESMMAADASLGAFLDQLDRAGRLRDAIVVITSDHGESFEKGFLGHAGALMHEALIRVPLVVKLPGQTGGQVLIEPVSQADVAPTLLDLVGAPALPQAEGRSLRAALQGQPLAPVPVFTMAMERQHRARPLSQGHFVVIDGRDKLTLTLAPPASAPEPSARASTLYDVVADPGETQDLATARPARVRELEALLRQRLAAAEQRRAAASTTR